jgi:two-component system, cell cycle response regulator DivK
MENEDEQSSWRVLIVDDDLDNLNVARVVLTFHGIEVYTAQDGVEGLAVLNHIHPTLILLDLSMPIMSGWEMLHAIRANSVTASIPVIALTAHALYGDRELILSAGFDGYISKPFVLTTFLREISQCLQQSANTGRH